jgi:hypothetical protein
MTINERDIEVSSTMTINERDIEASPPLAGGRVTQRCPWEVEREYATTFFRWEKETLLLMWC